ncbi:MAG: 5'/3'-nucleotidase SurE [Phycisphaerales bacterium]|nr:5'/3'-nucleotidase SurE [Phycisphaerales bacterium]
MTQSSMKILLTNDDGIEAPGIEVLHAAIVSLGEVLVVAPASAQSAKSHGITFHIPLLVREVEVNARMRGIAVEGTPADCVKLGLRSLWSERFGAGTRPDVVISGMNSGANVGINTIYSGTVAAAIEASFLGVPAIAVSLYVGDRSKLQWKRAAEIARTAIDHVLKQKLDAHRVLNINIPRVETPDAPMPPIKVVSMNTAAGADGYEKRRAPDGRTYYWPAGNGMEFVHTSEGTDVEAVAAGCVTVTPLNYDLTDKPRLGHWREALSSDPP